MTEPSVDAKLRSSFTKNRPEFTNRTPFTFIASAFALSRRSARCSIGIVNGIDLERALPGGVGDTAAPARAARVDRGRCDWPSRSRRPLAAAAPRRHVVRVLRRAESPRSVDERADSGADGVGVRGVNDLLLAREDEAVVGSDRSGRRSSSRLRTWRRRSRPSSGRGSTSSGGISTGRGEEGRRMIRPARARLSRLVPLRPCHSS